MNRDELRVVQLSEASQAEQAFSCMVEVPTPWPEALRASRTWIAHNLGTLIEGLHLQDSQGNVVGHVYYAFSAHALVPYAVEDGVAILYCEWIQRRRQGQGHSRQLFEALQRSLEAQEAKGILVAATEDEEFMHHRHYVRRGFHLLQSVGTARLMYYPLRQERIAVEARPVRITPKRQIPVEVLVFREDFCPYEASTSLVALQVAREFGNRVRLKVVAATVENLRTYGTVRGVWINGRRAPGAAPEEAIRQAILDALEGA